MHEWIPRFIQTLKSENTVSAYTNDLTQFVDFLVAFEKEGIIEKATRLGDVRLEHFQEFLFHLQSRDYAQSTIARKIASVRTFYGFLEQEGIAQQEAIKALASQPVTKTPPETLTADEIGDLLSAPDREGSRHQLRDKAMLELIHNTGLRATALLSLNVDDVITESARMHLRVPSEPSEGDRTNAEGSSTGYDLVPVTHRAKDALTAYLDYTLPRNEKDAPALFRNHKGDRLTRQGLWTILKRYLKSTRINRAVTLEMLRHSQAPNGRLPGRAQKAANDD